MAVFAAVLLILIWTVRLMPWGEYQSYPSDAWNQAKESLSGAVGSVAPSDDNFVATSPQVSNYFAQSFAAGKPSVFPFTEVRAVCEAADWENNEAYINCVGMSAGMTSIMSQIKVCFKMAIETGSHLMLPRMPLRDSKNLLDFNFLNGDAYMPYDEWFDADHLREQMQHACPKMKIIHPDDINNTVTQRHHLEVLCSGAPFYQQFHPYFWVGRPYKDYFNAQYKLKMDKLLADEEASPEPVATSDGITVVDVDSEFLLFRVTDDPTRRDLRLWTELSYLIRFREDVRSIIQRVNERLPADGNYMGVHFRAENDSIWSSAEHQLGVDLDALDRAWEKFGDKSEEKPPVYLACGDQEQIDMFSKAAAERGWTTTHKWLLVKDDPTTTDMIDNLAFDFQGAIDLGILLRSRFFMGVQGSAFSSTVANHRDVTGRYRGSSFEYPDEGAHTHLFNDLDATEYACCL